MANPDNSWTKLPILPKVDCFVIAYLGNLDRSNLRVFDYIKILLFKDGQFTNEFDEIVNNVEEWAFLYVFDLIDNRK